MIAALHPDWRAAWGGTIGGAALRAEMERNARLHGRMLAAIGERHGVSVLAPPRLDRTASSVVAALAEDRAGFVRLCGLSRIGRRLALATNRGDYDALAQAFGAAPLAAAARIAAALPPDAGGHGYDSQQLGPAVDRMGAGVIEEWAETLPRAAGEWIAMHLARSREEAAPLGAERARLIVEGVVERWPDIRGAADVRPQRRRRAA